MKPHNDECLKKRLWLRTGGAFLFSATAGVMYGAAESLTAAQRLPTALFNGGICAFIAVQWTAILLAGMLLLFGVVGWQPERWFQIVRSGSARSRHRRLLSLLLIPPAAFMWMTFIFHVTRMAMTRFNNMGLAALFCTALILTSVTLILLIVLRLRALLEPVMCTGLKNGPPTFLFVGTVILHFAALLVIFAGAPESGQGVVGFIGLLKREALDLSFLLPLALMTIFSLAGLAAAVPMARYKSPWVLLFFVVGIASAGFTASPSGLNHCASCLSHLENRTALTRLALPLLRRPFDADGDGFAARFGGGDCDDTNPDIHPAAIDIPGNGVDEDCSGTDAVPMSPRKKQIDATGGAADADTLSRTKLPDNLSLLFISVDSLRHDLGFTGYHRNISPNIDALARSGIAFTRTWSLSSFTGRAIGPMLIGRYPTETFCNASHLSRYSDKNRMLAEMLQEAGFSTGAVHAHPYFLRAGLQQGFAHYTVVEGKGGSEPDLRITAHESTAAALKLLSDPGFTEGRFFLWVHYMDPHKEYLEHPGFSTFGSDSRARYDGEVAFTDDQIGKLLAALKEKGLADRTAVVLTADHGEAFGEHNIRFHGRALFEEIMRVPWIFGVPGLSARSISLPVGHIDLVPTMLDLMSLPIEEGLRGRSLLPVMITGEGTAEPIYIEQPEGEYMPHMNALIVWPHKLIHTVSGNRFQLFHLENDPGETTDISGSQIDVLRDMKDRYSAMRASLETNADRYQRR